MRSFGTDSMYQKSTTQAEQPKLTRKDSARIPPITDWGKKKALRLDYMGIGRPIVDISLHHKSINKTQLP